MRVMAIRNGHGGARIFVVSVDVRYYNREVGPTKEALS
jgi:hypothetical protein